MNILLIFISVILLAIFQVSVLPFLSIWGIIINVFLLITLALAIRRWDEIAPIWVGIGGLLLDFFSSDQFGLYILGLGTSYLLIRWLSSKISILIEKQYLTAIWVFVGILYFEFFTLLILYISGAVGNISSYLVIIIKALIIHMLVYIPVDYLVRTSYSKKINKSQINL